MRTRLESKGRLQIQAEETDPEPAKRQRSCKGTLVDFLEARIFEKESEVRRSFVNRAATMAAAEGEPGPIGQLILAECATKRIILARWRVAAKAEGVTCLDDAVGTMAISCRSMLRILAAEYQTHPDFRQEWLGRA